MTAPLAAGGHIPVQPASVNVGAGFAVDPNMPQVGKLRFEVGPAGFEVALPSANVVAFLRGLADNIERQLDQAPKLARPASGLFLPNGG